MRYTNERKKLLIIIMISFIAINIFACNSIEKKTDLVIDSQVSNIKEEETETTKKEKYPEESIDIDLTTMSATMVKSVVSNINYSYEKYVGQIVKTNGECSIYHDEKNDKYYYTCVFIDSTRCCEVGLEFEPDASYVFPDDYPKDKDFVTVIGVFDYYKEGATTYKVLRDAEFIIMNTN